MFKRWMKHKAVMQSSFIMVLLIIWEGFARLKIFPEALFPSIEIVFKKTAWMIMTGKLISQTYYSVSIVILTMLMSLVFAFVLVVLGATSRYVRVNTELLNTILGPIPGVAILPFIILWLGISQAAMYVIMIHAMVWPIWITLVLSKDKIDQKYALLIRAFRVNKREKWLHVYLHGMIPEILSALEIAWGRGWRTLLSIEMIFGIVGNRGGLGWLVYERRMYMDTAGMISGLFAIAFCGILFESILFKSKRVEAFIETHYQS